MNKYRPGDLRDVFGDDYYKKIGQRGGLKADNKKSAETKISKYGKAYFSVIGKMGAERKRKNARKAK